MAPTSSSKKKETTPHFIDPNNNVAWTLRLFEESQKAMRELIDDVRRRTTRRTEVIHCLSSRVNSVLNRPSRLMEIPPEGRADTSFNTSRPPLSKLARTFFPDISLEKPIEVSASLFAEKALRQVATTNIPRIIAFRSKIDNAYYLFDHRIMLVSTALFKKEFAVFLHLLAHELGHSLDKNATQIRERSDQFASAREESCALLYKALEECQLRTHSAKERRFVLQAAEARMQLLINKRRAEDEMRADAFALTLLRDAGVPIEGAYGFIQWIKKVEPKLPSSLVFSHGSVKERTERMESLLKDEPKGGRKRPHWWNELQKEYSALHLEEEKGKITGLKARDR